MKTLFLLTILLASTVFSQGPGSDTSDITDRTDGADREIVYVNQYTSVPYDDQDGDSDTPFSSLDDAFDELSDDGGDIVFLGSTYILDETASFGTSERAPISVNLIMPAEFEFRFTENGRINCTNYRQTIIERSVKNVNLTIQNTVIVGQGNLPLFIGNCNFTLQNININGLTSSLFVLGDEGNIEMTNVSINDITLPDNQNLIDHDSTNRLLSDYLILDQLNISNRLPDSDGDVSTGIRSWLNWQQINITRSLLEGIGINIAGEQIGGNLKSDIYISNVTMQNAKTFVYIESYGNLTIQHSIFENATSRAIHFSLTDENLSPNQILIHNCRFIGNSAPIEGGAIAFQGTSLTSSQFNLNVLVQNSNFQNNRAALSGGAMAFLSLVKGNATIADTDFTYNNADVGGGCIHVDKASPQMLMVMRNTTCANNSAFQGGVYSIELTNQMPLVLEDNIWDENSAILSGSIGFLTDSTIVLLETGNDLTNDTAGNWALEGQSEITRI